MGTVQSQKGSLFSGELIEKFEVECSSCKLVTYGCAHCITISRKCYIAKEIDSLSAVNTPKAILIET